MRPDTGCAGRPGEEPGAEAVYDSYDALLLEQHKQGSIREYFTFDAALDDFYNKACLAGPSCM